MKTSFFFSEYNNQYSYIKYADFVKLIYTIGKTFRTWIQLTVPWSQLTKSLFFFLDVINI